MGTLSQDYVRFFVSLIHRPQITTLSIIGHIWYHTRTTHTHTHTYTHSTQDSRIITQLHYITLAHTHTAHTQHTLHYWPDWPAPGESYHHTVWQRTHPLCIALLSSLHTHAYTWIDLITDQLQSEWHSAHAYTCNGPITVHCEWVTHTHMHTHVYVAIRDALRVSDTCTCIHIEWTYHCALRVSDTHTCIHVTGPITVHCELVTHITCIHMNLPITLVLASEWHSHPWDQMYYVAIVHTERVTWLKSPV